MFCFAVDGFTAVASRDTWSGGRLVQHDDQQGSCILFRRSSEHFSCVQDGLVQFFSFARPELEIWPAARTHHRVTHMIYVIAFPIQLRPYAIDCTILSVVCLLLLFFIPSLSCKCLTYSSCFSSLALLSTFILSTCFCPVNCLPFLIIIVRVNITSKADK